MPRLIAQACCFVLLGTFLSYRCVAQSADRLVDIPAAVKSLPEEGAVLTFSPGDHPLPSGGHLQGIQWRYNEKRQAHLAFLSHDSNTVAYLLIVQVESNRPNGESATNRVLHVQHLPSDGELPPLRHAGGIQLVGDVLVVGVEDNQERTRSEVQFWDVADPTKPTQFAHLTIRRRSSIPKEMTAGAVGLVERERDHLLVVANWDSRALDFYVTNGKQLLDPQCSFRLQSRWQVETSVKTNWVPDAMFGSYQAINLLTDNERRVYLLGFETTLAGHDIIDLFSVDVQSDRPTLAKLARQQVRLGGDNHFRYAGGAIVEGGKLQVLSSQRNLAPKTRLNAVR